MRQIQSGHIQGQTVTFTMARRLLRAQDKQTNMNLKYHSLFYK